MNTAHHIGFVSRKMPPNVRPSQPGKIVEITYHELNSELRLSDSPGASSSHTPILIRDGFIIFAPFWTQVSFQRSCRKMSGLQGLQGLFAWI